MKLIPEKVDIKTGNKYIAVLHEDTARMFDLHAGDRIILKNKKNVIRALLDTTPTMRKDHIKLFTEAWDLLEAKKGDKITVEMAEKPMYIKEKLNGIALTKAKINEIVKDIVEDDLTDIEMTYFVSACYIHGLNDQETADLTRSIVANGNKLKFKDKIIVDKHCIGGVPGNRTTMIVVPMLTAAGLKMPKTSSRSITSPAGTADTMEVLANVTNQAPKLMKIANKVGGFITWGGGVDLAAADDRLIRVRHPLSLDPEGMLLASIMAKKHSVGANHVLIDIPIGKTVKISNMKQAQHLRQRFLKIAKLLGMKAEVIITDGKEPIGNGVGPLLEAIDVIKVLKNEKDAPQDLKNKCIKLVAILLELTKKAHKGQGLNMAKELLESGAAWKKMQEIIKEQGEKKIPKLSSIFIDIKAEKSGKVIEIHNKKISRVCRVAGAPKDIQGGVYLYKKTGDKVKKGEILFRIYSSSKQLLDYASKFAKEDSAYTIK